MSNFNYRTIIILSVLLFHWTSLASDPVNLYIIKDQNYLGDYNQLLGIAKKTKEYFAQHKIPLNTTEYNVADLKSFSTEIQNTKNPIIISAGLYGIEAIKLLKSENKTSNNILAIHVSHQILNNNKLSHIQLVRTEEKSSGADIIVLPTHILETTDRKQLESKYTKLVRVIGVAHNLELHEIEKEYAKFEHILPKADRYIGVILAGDAPDSNGKMHYYTESDAQKLAEYVSNLAIKQNYTVLVTNSPRTGKHNQRTNKEQPEVHQNGVMDPVTAKFQEVLIKNKVNFKLFDFQKNKPSFYKAMVGAILHHPSNMIFIPGESTSMISECLDILPGSNVVIYYNSAMNKNHERHVKSEYDNGRASVLQNMQLIKQKNDSIQKNSSANQVIAEAIYNLYLSDNMK